MFTRRRTLRRSTWAALAAFVFSTLAMAPLGLQAHAMGAGAEFHSDFCTSHADASPATPSPAVAPGEKPPTTKHCNDCAGCAGVAVALPPATTPWLAVAEATALVVMARPSVARHDDLLVARPRGPPAPA
jgi:hypothetical protein